MKVEFSASAEQIRLLVIGAIVLLGVVNHQELLILVGL